MSHSSYVYGFLVPCNGPCLFPQSVWFHCPHFWQLCRVRQTQRHDRGDTTMLSTASHLLFLESGLPSLYLFPVFFWLCLVLCVWVVRFCSAMFRCIHSSLTTSVYLSPPFSSEDLIWSRVFHHLSVSYLPLGYFTIWDQAAIWARSLFCWWVPCLACFYS